MARTYLPARTLTERRFRFGHISPGSLEGVAFEEAKLLREYRTFYAQNYSGDHLPPSLKPTCQREPHCLSTHKHAEWLVHGASTADSTGPVVYIDLTNDFKYFLQPTSGGGLSPSCVIASRGREGSGPSKRDCATASAPY